VTPHRAALVLSFLLVACGTASPAAPDAATDVPRADVSDVAAPPADDGVDPFCAGPAIAPGRWEAHPMDAHRLDSRAIQSRGQAQDVREGVGAFLEKREAVWPDRVSADLPGFFEWQGEPPFA